MQAKYPRPSRSFRPGACQKCGGDAFFDRGDEQEWRCLQCGRPLVSYALIDAEAHTSEALTSLQAGTHGDFVSRKLVR
jgi:hypothetical protein